MAGRKSLPYRPGTIYFAFVDMCGGSKDDAVLCIAHVEGRTIVIDLLEKQPGNPPFDTRIAVQRFCNLLDDYRVKRVTGDNYAGDMFIRAFAEHDIIYTVCKVGKTELYETFEPPLNSGEVQLPDNDRMQEQALTLVIKGSKIDHEFNGHDDYINAVAGCVWMARARKQHPSDEFWSAGLNALAGRVGGSGRGGYVSLEHRQSAMASRLGNDERRNL